MTFPYMLGILSWTSIEAELTPLTANSSSLSEKPR